MPGAHAKLAPSAASRWSRCPGSVALIESLPAHERDKPNPHSDRGTACHMVLAECLEKDVPPRGYIGVEMTIPYEHYEDVVYVITAEDAANIATCYDYVQKRISEYGPGTQILIEEKLDAGANFHVGQFDMETMGTTYKPAPMEGVTGTGDVVLIGGGYIEVIDYKNGTGYVEETENLQLLLYLIGALKHADPGTVQRARLTIAQPRALRPGVEPVRTWEFEERHIITWVVNLTNWAMAAMQPDAPRVPGEDQCRWCDAKAICPEYTGEVMEALTGAPAPAEQAPSPVAPVQAPGDLQEALTRAPEQLSMEQLTRVLDMEPVIRSWLSALHEHATSLLLRGETVPGYKLVSGRRSRKWGEDTEAMMKKFAGWNRIGDDGKAAGKLKRAEYTEVSVISPAQAENRIKPLVTPKTWANIEKCIAVSEGKPTLAPESDTRRAIETTTSAEAFGLSGDGQPESLPDFLS